MHNPTKLPVYRFDRADAALTLLPMAARRALDCAGLHLSLAGWQALPLEQREELVRLGGRERVDHARVAELLAAHAADVRAIPQLIEADLAAGPNAALLQALPEGRDLSSERWRGLSALDRYVLVQLARRGKVERLAEAYREICA